MKLRKWDALATSLIDFKQLENTDRVFSTLQFDSNVLLIGCEDGKIRYQTGFVVPCAGTNETEGETDDAVEEEVVEEKPKGKKKGKKDE